MLDKSESLPFVHWAGAERPRERFGRAIGCSVMLHLVPITYLVWQAAVTPQRQPAAESAPITVELAPLAASEPSPPDVRINERREQVDETPRPQTVAPDQPTIAKTEEAPAAEVKLRERQQTPAPPSPPARKQQEAAAQPQVAAAQPTPRAAAPVAGAAANTAATQSSWESQVAALLEKAKRYPLGAQWARQEDTILVRVAVARDGSVGAIKILKSRGYTALDTEARDLVKRVKLPPPPASIPENPVIITVPIQFYVQGK